MEGIILMVVIFIVSSLFGGKEKKEQKPMPPFNNKQTTQKSQTSNKVERRETRKSLEDFASEVFQQLNDKTATRTPQRSMEKSAQEVARRATKIEKDLSKPVTKNARPSLDANRSNRSSSITRVKNTKGKMKQREIGNFVPTNREALVQAIITSEILGPPKAKQHS
ncbi:hypothetical protein ACH0B5_04885 [Ureibacillus sp. 179-F W5.1 NHS]|uniref:Uncharacterized protein n=1 Tax=Lysinibacillus halotolerans TaxID=1368476 RepID=A0A3M8HCG5_9BACI|nr:hypothetical protein [Lysinibacillus halotolerans]RND00020.1 hypothetical protein EC501_05785 [Lysinibacillus halotolerans]